MDHVEFTYTAGMDEERVAERLRSAETGVLSLADGDDAYAIPVAYHVEDGAILFRLGRHADAEKLAYAESTDRACFVVYDYESPRSSWSVLARGTLHRLPADRYDEATINRWFPQLRVFGEDIEDLTVELYELRIESLTGRETLDS